MLLQALFKVKELAQCSLFKLISILLLLTACTSDRSTQNATNSDSNATNSAAKTGGTLIWARYGDADFLDPHRTTTTLSWQIFDRLYDSLLAFNDKGEIVPNLAKSWKISRTVEKLLLY